MLVVWQVSTPHRGEGFVEEIVDRDVLAALLQVEAVRLYDAALDPPPPLTHRPAMDRAMAPPPRGRGVSR